MPDEISKPKPKPKGKSYVAVRGINIPGSDGKELRFEPGDKITTQLSAKALASWLPRGIVEEVK